MMKKETRLDERILVTRMLPETALSALYSRFRNVAVHQEDRPMTREELLDGVRNKDGILCLLTDTIDSEILFAADQARVLANMAVGYNNVDVSAATQRRILVTNTPGVLTETTADLTWALILSLSRRIVECDRFTREGLFEGWGPMLLLGTEVTGKTLGIVGAGRIGSAVAQRAFGFSMRILYADKSANSQMEIRWNAARVSLDELLSVSDIVTLHVPLNEETRHLIGSERLNRMKRSAFLINTSRGPIIDEEAMGFALEQGRIAGAGLDVYEQEPHVPEKLRRMDNVVLLPHIGSGTIESRTKMALMAVDNLIAGMTGERPPNLVNPEVWAKRRGR